MVVEKSGVAFENNFCVKRVHTGGLCILMCNLLPLGEPTSS
jgi:hypothetical protein